MRFKVPQFIDIEDKSIGPLTWSQLGWCAGAVGCLYLGFRFIDSRIIAFLVSMIPVSLFLSLAFIKINNRPFLEVGMNALIYFFNNNLYIWQQNKKDNLNTLEESLKKIEERKKAEALAKNQTQKTIDIHGLAERLDK